MKSLIDKAVRLCMPLVLHAYYPLRFPGSAIRSFAGLRPNAEMPLKIGRNVQLTPRTSIGKYTVILDYVLVGRNTTGIGRFCSIAYGCVIGPNHHPLDRLSSSACFYSSRWRVSSQDGRESANRGRKTDIGHDVWIGANAVVLGGVTIGTGAIIGAGAVVTKDVPAYAVVTGVPAKMQKLRFDPDICERLLRTEWWRHDVRFLADCYRQEHITDVLAMLERASGVEDDA